MKRWTVMAVFVMSMGCGDDDGTPVLPTDALVDAPAQSISLRTFETPVFIQYRDGVGEWKTPTEAAVGSYGLLVTGPYEVVVVCGSTVAGWSTSVLRAAPADGALQYMFCSNGASAAGPGASVRVNGTVAQPGAVWMRGSASSETAPWTFELDVWPGIHDLIAFDTERVVIRKDLGITEPTTVDPIDLDSEGAAFTTSTLTLIGAEPDEDAINVVSIFTANGYASIHDDGLAVRTVPGALLATNEVQVVTAQVNTPQSTRFVAYSPASTTTTTFTLLPRLSGVTIRPDGASWSTLPEGTVLFDVSGPTGNSLQLQATPSWLGATTSVTVDLDLPGYDASWQPDPANHYRSLGVLRDVGPVTYMTLVSETVGTPARVQDASVLVRPAVEANARARARASAE